MENMGKHTALLSQKFLLTLYKMNVTKSCKKIQKKKTRVSKTAALGDVSRHLVAEKWHGRGTGDPGAAPIPSFTMGLTCSSLSPLTNHYKTAPRGA